MTTGFRTTTGLKSLQETRTIRKTIWTSRRRQRRQTVSRRRPVSGRQNAGRQQCSTGNPGRRIFWRMLWSPLMLLPESSSGAAAVIGRNLRQSRQLFVDIKKPQITTEIYGHRTCTRPAEFIWISTQITDSVRRISAVRIRRAADCGSRQLSISFVFWMKRVKPRQNTMLLIGRYEESMKHTAGIRKFLLLSWIMALWRAPLRRKPVKL